MSARKRGPSSKKEPEVPSGTVFAAIVAHARTQIAVLKKSLVDGSEDESYVHGHIDGMEAVLVLVQRAGAGKPIGEPMLVKVERKGLEEDADPGVLRRLGDLERRVAQLEELARRFARPTVRMVPSILEPPAARPEPIVRRRPVIAGAGDVGKMELALLEVLAQRRELPTTNEQLAILAKYAQSGSFSKALARLREHGLVAGSKGELRITSAGIVVAGDVAPLPTGSELLSHYLFELEESSGRLLRVIAAAHPAELSKADLLERTGYRDSGSFSKALAKLRKLKLVTGRFPVRASRMFFPEER